MKHPVNSPAFRHLQLLAAQSDSDLRVKDDVELVDEAVKVMIKYKILHIQLQALLL